MPKIEDLQGNTWINPYDVDHYDPMNRENPDNALYYIADQVHRLEMFMNNEELQISEQQILECIDNLTNLAKVARQKQQQR